MVDWKALGEERQEDKKRFYVVMSGDKAFKRTEFIHAVIGGYVTPTPAQEIFNLVADKLLVKAKANYKEIRVVIGDNNGADDIAMTYAIQQDFDIYKYEADWDNSGNKAAFERNEKMFVHVGRREHKAAIIFWDGEDYMTKNLIYQAYNYCVPIRVYNYRKARLLTQEEVTEVQLGERQNQMKFGKY
jgi:hypothetical protein